ncbi:hypothetical protein NLM33_16135 [Bradyrhizobium sp. CCGUVB1N3]|uniref:hypothetical protein n=1 Tax=Bradyrhizobium sp. CCGUVB1N3 TaxID=2949629 RepID=UPI0020B19249|nr:hypothetical protein [Bradyrhizobium sp. CCGUVB1N3]MCP3471845.1 hypothetical protein [Bradyrhizobium sp. CCGUVB1N3]
MPITTLKVLASLMQLHGPGATIQSDHQGIDALLNDLRGQSAEQGVVSGEPVVTQAAFRRGAFAKGANAGAFRRAGYAPGVGAFRRGGFVRGY